jgi:N-acetylglutamate synthase
MGRHVAVAAAGFEVPEEIFAAIMIDKALELPQLRCYVAELEGEPVTTGVGVLEHGLVGVLNIATPPAHRRAGYAAAITARIVADGLAAGARGAYLQSSAAGYAIYQRLGFDTVERWSVWI